MAKRRRSGEREAFWQAVVRRHQSSGQSVRAFCLAERLSEASFYAWRKTLAQRDAAVQTAPSAPDFLPVLLTAAAPSASTASAGIVIDLRGARRLHLPESMTTEQVVALVRGLEAGEVTS